jgi:hypothetical protein
MQRTQIVMEIGQSEVGRGDFFVMYYYHMIPVTTTHRTLAEKNKIMSYCNNIITMLSTIERRTDCENFGFRTLTHITRVVFSNIDSPN